MELFDIDVNLDEGVSEKAIEKVKSLILEKGDDEELIEEIKESDFSAIINEEVEEVEEIVTFACPICDSEVGENDSQCPNCGAIFEEEEEFENTVEDLSVEETEQEKTFDNEVEDLILDFQEKIDLHQKRIDRFEKSGLDMRYLKGDLNELRNAQSERNEKKYEKLSNKIEDKIEHVENIIVITTKFENLLNALSEDIDISKWKKKLDKIYEGCEIGEYEVASKRAEKIQKEIIEEINQLDKKLLDDLIEKKTKEARELIDNIKLNLNIERLEEKIDEALSARKEGNIGEGVQKAIEALDSASKISQISEKIEEANKYVEDIKKRGMDTSEYLDNIDDSIQKIETGEKEIALEIIEDTIGKMKRRLEKYEEEETEKESSQEPSEKIQNKIIQMKSFLEQVEKFDIEINEGEKMINEAERYFEENENEKGLDKLKEMEKTYRGRVEKKIDEIIQSFNDETSEIPLEKNLSVEEVEELKEKGEYDKILDLIESAEENIDSQKKIKKDLKDDILKMERVIEHGEDFDFGMKDVKILLEEGEKKIEEGNWSKAKYNIKNSQKMLKQKILDYLKEEIKNAKKKLKGVKNDDFDVTKPISFLKDANRARKENQLEESFKALENYKKEMEDIFENT